jgi:polysaccharide biosynthesis/export protein
MSRFRSRVAILILTGLLVSVAALRAQNGSTATAAVAKPISSVVLPDGYTIGPEDVIGVIFWREQEMTGDVVVRPDGMISLPLLGDVKAAGLRPEALRDELQKAAARYLADPNVSVIARQINSRKVFITGQVKQPGAFPLAAPRTVLQLIALAGGLLEYADGENITIMRAEQGGNLVFKFNYKDVSKGKRLAQNITLQPGDTVVVP